MCAVAPFHAQAQHSVPAPGSAEQAVEPTQKLVLGQQSMVSDKV